ncbi:MAG: hypothetical protein ACTSU9_14885 [Promethearchaeota archaeon]
MDDINDSFPLSNTIFGFSKGGFITDVGDKETEIRYVDIIRISIKTTDDGPFLPDCFWYIETKKHTIILENEDPSMSLILPKFQALDGFDNEGVIKAMTSVDYNEFIVYERP